MIADALSEQAAGSVERCELCIVGAGIGGLSALFAASRHLSPRDRVLMIDRHPRVGGMWNSTYDYIRLHQPHPMFTAGNIAWAGSNSRSHLASRTEVLAHLQHCFDTLSQRVNLELRGGYAYEGHEEDEARGTVRVRCVPVEPGGPELHIEAKRLVDAAGFGFRPLPPLKLSSTQVRSVSPDMVDLSSPQFVESSAPIYIVGGGKTAMDTAYTLIRRFPGKRVRLLIGVGTFFMERDGAFPDGWRRYLGGTVGTHMFVDLVSRFDGNNELPVLERFRELYGIALDPRCRRHMLGLLSRHENETIRRGSEEILMDYLSDVVDEDGRPVMVLRSGETRAVEPGSWFINATGYFQESPIEYRPFASASGRVLAINPRSSLLILPAYSGYILVHAAYNDLLRRLPLYELDSVTLLERAKDAFFPTVATHLVHNLLQLMRVLPSSVRQEFGSDTSSWFPKFRQLWAGVQLMRFQNAHPEHLRRSLDRVRERFDVRLGPLAN